jgi:hypothetical protein
MWRYRPMQTCVKPTRNANTLDEPRPTPRPRGTPRHAAATNNTEWCAACRPANYSQVPSASVASPLVTGPRSLSMHSDRRPSSDNG